MSFVSGGVGKAVSRWVRKVVLPAAMQWGKPSRCIVKLVRLDILKQLVVDVPVRITDVRLRRVDREGQRMLAIASVTIEGSFVVHGIRVINGKNGKFVAMPSKRTPDGEFRDIAHPICAEAREQIEAAVLKEYYAVEPQCGEEKAEHSA